MTRKEKEIRIAEALGAVWVEILPKQHSEFEYHPKRLLTFKPDDLRILPLADPLTGDAALIPNYFEDLDSCLSAQGMLSSNGRFEFVYHLNDALGLVPLNSPASFREVVLFAFANAPAAKRAEAIYQTLCANK